MEKQRDHTVNDGGCAPFPRRPDIIGAGDRIFDMSHMWEMKSRFGELDAVTKKKAGYIERNLVSTLLALVAFERCDTAFGSRGELLIELAADAITASGRADTPDPTDPEGVVTPLGRLMFRLETGTSLSATADRLSGAKRPRPDHVACEFWHRYINRAVGDEERALAAERLLARLNYLGPDILDTVIWKMPVSDCNESWCDARLEDLELSAATIEVLIRAVEHDGFTGASTDREFLSQALVWARTRGCDVSDLEEEAKRFDACRTGGSGDTGFRPEPDSGTGKAEDDARDLNPDAAPVDSGFEDGRGMLHVSMDVRYDPDNERVPILAKSILFAASDYIPLSDLADLDAAEEAVDAAIELFEDRSADPAARAGQKGSAFFVLWYDEDGNVVDYCAWAETGGSAASPLAWLTPAEPVGEKRDGVHYAVVPFPPNPEPLCGRGGDPAKPKRKKGKKKSKRSKKSAKKTRCDGDPGDGGATLADCSPAAKEAQGHAPVNGGTRAEGSGRDAGGDGGNDAEASLPLSAPVPSALADVPEIAAVLSPRNIEVLASCLELGGKDEAATALGIHPDTVRYHVKEAVSRFGLDSEADLARHLAELYEENARAETKRTDRAEDASGAVGELGHTGPAASESKEAEHGC